MTERAQRAERRLAYALIVLGLFIAVVGTLDYYGRAHEKRDRIAADQDFILRIEAEANARAAALLKEQTARAAANRTQIETNCRQFRDGLRNAILRGAELRKREPGADPRAIDLSTRGYLAEVIGPIDCTLTKPKPLPPELVKPKKPPAEPAAEK